MSKLMEQFRAEAEAQMNKEAEIMIVCRALWHNMDEEIVRNTFPQSFTEGKELFLQCKRRGKLFDLHGRWQKKVNGTWVDVKGQFSWLDECRIKEFYLLIIQFHHLARKDFTYQTAIDERLISEAVLGEVWYSTLRDLKNLLYYERSIEKDGKDKLLSFILDIMPYIEDGLEDDDYRIVYMLSW